MESNSNVGEGAANIQEDQIHLELDNLYALNDNLRQENHELKRALDEQMSMVKTVTIKCALLQGDYDELKHKEEHHDEIVKLEDLESREKNDDETRLEEQNKKLAEDALKLREDISCLAEKNKNLEELVSEKILEVAGLKESLKCAEEESVSLEKQLQVVCIVTHYLMETLKKAKNQLFCLQTAHSGSHAKLTPMSARGDSIFADAEDEELKIHSKYKEIKEKYSELAKKSEDMFKFFAEVMKKEEEKDKTDLIQALEKRISDLDRANRDLTSELRVPVKVVTKMDLETLKYVETIAEDSRQEVWNLRREFDERSAALLTNQRQLNSCQNDLRRYKAENLKLEWDLSEATLKLQSLKENIPQDLSADEKIDPVAPTKTNVLREVLGSNKQTCSPGLSKKETKCSNKTDFDYIPKLVSSKLEHNPELPKPINKNSDGHLDESD